MGIYKFIYFFGDLDLINGGKDLISVVEFYFDSEDGMVLVYKFFEGLCFCWVVCIFFVF